MYRMIWMYLNCNYMYKIQEYIFTSIFCTTSRSTEYTFL